MMVRNRVRKTQMGLTDASVMKSAVLKVLQGEHVRKVARIFNLNHATLGRYAKRYQRASAAEKEVFKFTPNYNANKIFSDSFETFLYHNLVKACEKGTGLTAKQARKLVYKLVKSKRLQVPKSWHRDEAAGIEWFFHFRKRQPELHLTRNTTAVSINSNPCLIPVTNIGNSTIDKFSNNLNSVSAIFRIFNENRNISSDTCKCSNDGNSTFCNGTDSSYLVFPRIVLKNFSRKSESEEPCSMNRITLDELRRLHDKTGSSTTNPVILMIKNHDFLIGDDVVQYAKKHGISLLPLIANAAQHCPAPLSMISVCTTQPEFIECDTITGFSPNVSPVSANMSLVDSHSANVDENQEETRNNFCLNGTFNHGTNAITDFLSSCAESLSFTDEDSSKNECEIKLELDVSDDDSNESFHDLENTCEVKLELGMSDDDDSNEIFCVKTEEREPESIF